MRPASEGVRAASAPLLTPPSMVTRYSELGTPAEPRPWWAPAGWLLVAVGALLLYGAFLVLSPLVLLWIGVRRLWVRTLRYRRRPEDLRVAIIGGGWSGLQALARFRTLGVDQVDVFERYDTIGGTWSPHLRYHGLQIHGSMTVTSFDGLPYSDDPDVQGGKVMAEEVERYIHRFADTNDLMPAVQLSSNVDSLSYSSDDRTATLSITDPRTGKRRTSGPYDLVVWASMAAYGAVPRLPGAEVFRGRSLHTSQSSTAEIEEIIRTNRHVVVVGGGKAACDMVLGLRRAGYENFTWVMRKPYLFYRYEALLHDAKPIDRIRGLSYLATVIWTGVSKRLGAVLHWSSGYLVTYGRPHTDFTHFHGGVLCATQRRDIAHVPHTIGNPVRFDEDGLVLEDGRTLPADVVIWATGNRSGIDTLGLTKDGEPFALDPASKLFHHFQVPELPALASTTALWTTFGPMRATNAADLAVYSLCVAEPRSERSMRRAAQRQLSTNSLLRSFIWAKDACWLQQWVLFHIDLVLQGITPIEAFLKHAIEVFVLAKETPLRFDLLPRQRSDAPVPDTPRVPPGVAVD
ncbi:FAD-dependent oxidoreductase [Amnibacterium sp. CER49]|uniref:SidA/IucD/PvdA family monooxygenase n=1 Tax=Amnibacterium sp. CER49 TaxID=3039161 RepID=UPI00244D7C5C|nr:SidA/IucD/PvdA family monooxygenase [Amnibacterium sp. CER49]MDH2442367.1 FAD-dependent oxidoreductase [Amnibacterium sp. CER49]